MRLAASLGLLVMLFSLHPGRGYAQDGEASVTPVVEALLGAIRLPQVVSEAREAGVADATITALMDEFRGVGMPAADAESVLEQEVEVVRAGGPPDRFGAFVQSRLDAGLRGRDLAAAIRAEHRARGIGVPERRPDRTLGRGPGNGRGPGANGRPTEPGGSMAPGQQGGRGRSGDRGPRGQGGNR